MKLRLVLALMVFALTACEARPLRIGSKNFTESVVLGEILRSELATRGLAVEHRRALGGSAILWQALRNGDIDAYTEYTGTLTQELLREVPAGIDLPGLRARLALLGIGISEPLGFSDSYALGVTESLAQKLNLKTLSDLRAHPELRYGLSNEFLDRGDGWRALREAYSLEAPQVQGLDHDLAYRALPEHHIDVTDLYTTDAEIAYYTLRALTDDRHHFPEYAAVVLYRLDAARQHPQLLAALNALAGRIDASAMQRMNAAVKLEGHSEADVAAQFLGRAVDTNTDNWRKRLLQRTAEHLQLVLLSLGGSLLLGLPLGIAAAQSPRAGAFVLAATSTVQTIPALAMLVLLIPWLGIGTTPAIVALGLYGLLPIVRNTLTGLTGIPQSLQESAAALGLPWLTRLWRIDLPLAARTILAGISTATIIDIGTATLGALIGAGGYGQPILTGIRLDNFSLILEGALPAAALALLAQAAFAQLDRRLASRS